MDERYKKRKVGESIKTVQEERVRHKGRRTKIADKRNISVRRGWEE